MELVIGALAALFALAIVVGMTVRAIRASFSISIA